MSKLTLVQAKVALPCSEEESVVPFKKVLIITITVMSRKMQLQLHIRELLVASVCCRSICIAHP